MSYAGEVLADAPAYWFRLSQPGGMNAFAYGVPTPMVLFASGSVPVLGNAGISDDDGSMAMRPGAGSLWSLGVSPMSNPFSWEFWFWPADEGGPSFGDIAGNVASSQGFRFQYDASTHVLRAVVVIAGTPTNLSSAAVSRREWHHCVLTYDGTNYRWYVDTVLTGPTALGYPTSGGLGAWTLGSVNAGSIAVQGFICEPAIYPTALSAARVTAHYNAATRSAIPVPIGYWTLAEIIDAQDQLAAILASVRKSYG